MPDITTESMLPPSQLDALEGMRTAPTPRPVDDRYVGFFGQTSQYIAQGTHQSLAKYFGIADKMGLTDAMTEPEFNALKGGRNMTFRPGFSRQTWDNEIDAHDIGTTMSRLEENGLDNTFAMLVGSVLGGFTDPVNVAGMYLAPMLGALAIGANAITRGGVAAILRTEGPEALVKFLSANPTGYFQQVKRAAIFGAAEGAAEIPADKYLSELTGQRTYTAADAGLNILTGAALSAAVTGVLDPALSGTIRAVQKRWNKTFKETNTFAGQLAAKGINDGRPVTVAEVEANVAKMDTYQPSAKRQVERTDGKKAMTPERAAPTPQRVTLTVPDVTHPLGAPLDFKGDDVSKGLYAVASGNKDVEDQLMHALIDNGTFHADVPSTREALQQAAAEIKTKVDAQGPSVPGGIDFVRAFKDSNPTDKLYEGLYGALSEGKTTYAGVKDPVLQKYKAEYDAGRIQSAEDLKKAVNRDSSVVPTVATKPVRVKVDGIPTLARIRDKVVPQAAVLKTETPEAQAMVDHTVRPSDHDLLVGQDYKATHIAAIDNHSNQILKDMDESGAFTPEELQAVNAQANKLAGILDAARVCPTR